MVKYLQDRKKNGGFTLPNCFLYYQASSLVQLKDWITLTDVKTLTLEGHGLLSGWHSYLWLKRKLLPILQTIMQDL